MKSKQTKGIMARRLVYYCITALSITLVWALVLKTLSIFTDVSMDLSDILTYAASVFGGELLMLLCKRIFAKPKTQEIEGGENDGQDC